jgi:hypothetical protein
MTPIDFPIERLNEFFRDHSFEIQNPFGDGLNDEINVTVKVQLTGVKPMISVGEWKDFIEYTLFLEDIDSDFGRGIFGYQFAALKTHDYKISNTDTTFYLTTVKVNDMLRNFLKYWGIDNNYVTCTRIVNKVANIDPKYMTEGLITEGKYDSVVKQLVKDVLTTIKYQKEGDFYLPEDVSQGMFYKFPQIESEFNIELSLQVSDEVETVDVDGAYYPDDDVIEISIVTNPNLNREILEELYYELNELIRHELEHIIQFERGDNIPTKEPKVPLKYYSQKHELEAQIAGFKRRAQKEKKPLEDVIRSWFIKNKLRHRLSPKNVEVVINRILELS